MGVRHLPMVVLLPTHRRPSRGRLRTDHTMCGTLQTVPSVCTVSATSLLDICSLRPRLDEPLQQVTYRDMACRASFLRIFAGQDSARWHTFRATLRRTAPVGRGRTTDYVGKRGQNDELSGGT